MSEILETPQLSIATDARLELMSGDAEIQIGATVALLPTAGTHLAVRLDDRHEMAMRDARERMRHAFAATNNLIREVRTAGITTEANDEWRHQRDGRRRA